MEGHAFFQIYSAYVQMDGVEINARQVVKIYAITDLVKLEVARINNL